MSGHPFQSKSEKKHNRLLFEKSPYLLQHAHNPVDWYPWNEEAFEKAKKENKPIFLSIGYSTCHWCHVMAHESFEDPEVAKLMNNTFVCIKVDREERPDIDKIYMAICQILTGSGGWPLTIIMTPEKKPFFAGTYLPKNGRFGLMGLLELIPHIKKLWETHDKNLIIHADQVTSVLQDFEKKPQAEDLDESILRETYEILAEDFDKQFGGFGMAPKFPTPHNILFLLRYWKRTGISDSLSMAEKTLQEMRAGGIYDHIGFGFHRYSTDLRWFVPHFEKMLYDQALLAMAYTETYQATKNEGYLQTAQEIFSYILRDMTAPEGGFYSAEDADSEGEEGKFYLWTYDEVRQALTEEDADLVIKVFNLSQKGNFQADRTKQKTTRNIFHIEKSFSEIAFDLGIAMKEFKDRIENARKKLFAIREEREHPYKDDKILTDWNGLMIAALAKAGRVFDEHKYKEAASRAADFILTNLRTHDGRLLHRYRNGQANIKGYLDDYAFFIWGLLELYETTFEVSYLKSILKLQQDLEKHFWDQSGGGFFFTPNASQDILVRQKELYDGAIPSGNSVCVLNLLRLFHITANSHFAEKAAAIGRIFSQKVKESPNRYTQFMVALDFAFGTSHEVVIVGHPHTKDTKEMLMCVQKDFMPNKTVILRTPGQKASQIDEISPFIKYCKSIGGKATAYVCQNQVCRRPTTEVNKLLEMLNARNKE